MNVSRQTIDREEVLEKLRAFLAERGDAYEIQALGCAGSVARGEAMADSDVDVVYEVTPSARLTLFDLALLREELMERLGRPVNLIEFCTAISRQKRQFRAFGPFLFTDPERQAHAGMFVGCWRAER